MAAEWGLAGEEIKGRQLDERQFEMVWTVLAKHDTFAELVAIGLALHTEDDITADQLAQAKRITAHCGSDIHPNVRAHLERLSTRVAELSNPLCMQTMLRLPSRNLCQTRRMDPVLYRDLVRWYHLLDPVEDHRDEAECYGTALERAATPPPVTLLELGCGAGNNASFLKRRFRCTLTDLSADMLALSRARNPECEHVRGDMRTLRLGREFDAVFLHDAVTYMTDEEDLVAAIRTAQVHTRPGGAALFAPDCVRETFREKSGVISGHDGPLSLRCLEWHWDPDPEDGSYIVDFAFLLRENGTIRAVHDRHAQGLFAEDRWLALLGAAGFEAELIRGPLDEPGEHPRVFVCRRPPG